MRIFTTFMLFALSLIALATEYDQNKPFGFCTRLSRTDASCVFNVTGGGYYTYPIAEGFTGKVIVLKSNGQDMKRTIENAVKQNDIIILDGASGDFFVSKNIAISASDKTLIGINNARLCTQWSITKEIRDALNQAGVPNMSTSGGTGGILSNGHRVGEEAEYQTRQIIINMTNDEEEKYRSAGVLTLNKCQNIIIRNLKFVGPGSIDVGGSDLLSCRASKNCWIDHCEFTDGMDGNLDITNSSDFNTVSWCTFSYTDRSYMHQNTNLIGYSDREPKGFLNTTYAFNWWGDGCRQRMPMARIGKVHMLNNYFSSTTASNCINPRKNSEVLIEGNYFEKGVRRYYSQKDAVAVTWTDANFAEEKNKMGQPASIGEPVTIPYEYTVAQSEEVPTMIQEKAGATLFNNKTKKQ